MSSARTDHSGQNAVHPRGLFTVEPFTEASRVVWEQRQHVVFGVSPGNSYFRPARLEELLGWLCSEFDQVDVVIPDSALARTYQALGYDAQRAAKKARSEINVLNNRVDRAWESNGGPRAADGVHRISDLASDAVYQEKLAECEQALKEDDDLFRTCAEMTREVLAAKGHEGPADDDQIDQAMGYLTSELPFFLASSEIFGVPTSLNFYHRELPLAEFIFSGKSQLRAAPGQAYATIRPT
ncbi:tRNA-dependent cyclodipeptide synthase [Umezawaea sp. Da 62-37]|uniref:tRNA-dependent cyclodipeptide synthase n=1 Tax=Umezawaea sp. Da 62-37 TaxID=3075927 RepID=UPI0028F6CB80|nr:tRNA-dependent cyclodipeptide synthase [Umezawaea sp. Da 62-37]WNV87773.1 tRNA-dependent cyclodipeptide synthase [Umezawaea sp. Da 62-37]